DALPIFFILESPIFLFIQPEPVSVYLLVVLSPLAAEVLDLTGCLGELRYRGVCRDFPKIVISDRDQIPTGRKLFVLKHIGDVVDRADNSTRLLHLRDRPFGSMMARPFLNDRVEFFGVFYPIGVVPKPWIVGEIIASNSGHHVLEDVL